MKPARTVVVVAALLMLTGRLTCSGAEPSPPRPPLVTLPEGVRLTSVAETSQLIQEGRLSGIVDLRTPDEVKSSGHLPNAQFLDFFGSNFTDLFRQHQPDLNQPVLLYCALGGRAKRAAVQLTKQGYKNLLVLEGGYEAWRRQKTP